MVVVYELCVALFFVFIMRVQVFSGFNLYFGYFRGQGRATKRTRACKEANVALSAVSYIVDVASRIRIMETMHSKWK